MFSTSVQELEPEAIRSVATLTRRARRRLLAAGLSLVAIVALSYVVPGLEDLRPAKPEEDYVPFWNILGRTKASEERLRRELAGFEALALAAERESAQGLSDVAGRLGADHREGDTGSESGSAPADTVAAARFEPPPVFPPYAGHPDDEASVAEPIEWPRRLEHYFGQLTLVDMGVPGAIARAGQWGDSVLGGDGLTHVLRSKLQSRFGDAGHGFHALSKYGVGYRHRGVYYKGDRWRSCEIIFKCRRDGRYGYAGVSSGSTGGGWSRWRTARDGVGSSVSRFEIWYQKGPRGGLLQVNVDGDQVTTLDTRAERPSDAVFTIEMEDGAHSLQVRAAGRGEVRGYGVVLEREGPGVVWDELSLIGSFTQRLDYQEPDHLAWQLERREVDLMVFMFGGNDVQRDFDDPERGMEPYEREYERVISKFRRGRPRADCLVMSLIDHGERVGKNIVTRPVVPRLVSAQRRVAEQMGCAFFNTFRAMGGRDSIGRWYHARPQLGAGDFSHPTAAGQGVIANLVYRALMKEYAAFRRRSEGELLPPLGGYDPPERNL